MILCCRFGFLGWVHNLTEFKSTKRDKDETGKAITAPNFRTVFNESCTTCKHGIAFRNDTEPDEDK
jgi:hypothetical protein